MRNDREQEEESRWPHVLLAVILLTIMALVLLGLWQHVRGPRSDLSLVEQPKPVVKAEQDVAPPAEPVQAKPTETSESAAASPVDKARKVRKVRKVGPWTVRQLANPRLFNRDPVIGEDGTVAWWVTRTQAKGSDSEVFVSRGGSTRCVTCAMTDARFHGKPVTRYGRVLWTAVSRRDANSADFTYRLVDPPDGTAKPPSRFPKRSAAANETAVDTNLLESGWQFVNSDATNSNERWWTGTNSASATSRRWNRNELYEHVAGGRPKRLTTDDRNDLGVQPMRDGGMVWQKAVGFPFGWEIMVDNGRERFQITTNFYYDMAPQANGKHVVWYGWDSEDYEIYLSDGSVVRQLTDNRYDDEEPQFDGEQVVWQGFSSLEPDIFRWRPREGVRQLSVNPLADENAVTWNGTAVWQSYDGSDREIAIFADVSAEFLTQNQYDDVNPAYQDGVLVWVAYVDNWDPEIMVWDGSESFQLTDNEMEDTHPQTAGGRVVWQAEDAGGSYIFVAERDDL